MLLETMGLTSIDLSLFKHTKVKQLYLMGNMHLGIPTLTTLRDTHIQTLNLRATKATMDTYDFEMDTLSHLRARGQLKLDKIFLTDAFISWDTDSQTFMKTY